MAWQPLLGWVSPDQRTQEQNDAHDAANASMPQFAMPSFSGNEVFLATKKFDLTEIWAHQLVIQSIGFKFKRFHQLTGSCVGAGGGQTIFTTIAGDAILRNEPEEIFLPFWPFDYGLSRQLGGWNKPGDGSLGSLFAKIVRDDGIIRADTPGLPQFKQGDDDGLTLTSKLEYEWSVGKNIDPALIEAGRKHPIKTTTLIRTTTDAKNAILNLYGLTFANDYYIGNAHIKGSGQNACVTGKLDTPGGHQVAILGYWEHPDLGPLFKYQNNWPAEVYPRDPLGGSPCAVWQPEEDLQKALDHYHAETYAFSGFEGFPAKNIPVDYSRM